MDRDIGPLFLDEAIDVVREALEVRDLRVGEHSESAMIASTRTAASVMQAIGGRRGPRRRR